MRLVSLTASLGLCLALLVTPTAYAVTEADCTITGTAAGDVLVGTDGDDIICGLGGNDVVEAGDGNDIILGGDGKDSIDGGLGDDKIFGGPGADLLWGGDGEDALAGADGNDGLTGGDGADRLAGGDGVDYCAADSADPVQSSCFRDGSKPRVIALAYQKSKYSSDTDTIVRLRATITDAGTGVMSVGADVWAMLTPYTLSASGSALCLDHAAAVGEACLLSGNRNRGVWELAFPLPAHTPARRFNQLALFVSDSASNQSYIEAVGNLAVSFSTLSNSPDTKAPIIKKVRADIPKTVDAEIAPTFEVTIQATDNLSGIKSLSATFRSGLCLSAKQMQSKLCQNAPSDRDSNRVAFAQTESGSWVGTLQIQPGMFNARWRLFNLSVRDAVGNSREIYGNAVTAFGVPHFTVVNGTTATIGDVVAPIINAVSIAPAIVNASNAPAVSYVTIKASDNVGIAMVWASVVGPNSYVSEPELSCTLVAGSKKAGSWKCGVRIPAHGARGKWRVLFLARDSAGNDAELAPAVEALSNNDGYFVTNN